MNARVWLWENYGPGIERELAWTIRLPEFTTEDFIAQPIKWAWYVDDRTYYIYLKDEVVTHFSLKYINT